eukprot:gene12555-12688_t
MASPPSSWSVDIAAERAKVQQPWRLVEEAIHKHSLPGIRAPGIRNETHDFVREGRLLSKYALPNSMQHEAAHLNQDESI